MPLFARCLLLSDLHALLSECITHTLQTGADHLADLLADFGSFLAADGTPNGSANSSTNPTRMINGLVRDRASDLARHLADTFANAFSLVTVQQIADRLANRSTDRLARAFAERLSHGTLIARPFLGFFRATLFWSLRSSCAIRTCGHSCDFTRSLLDTTDWIGGHRRNTGHSLICSLLDGTCRLLDSASNITADGGRSFGFGLAR